MRKMYFSHVPHDQAHGTMAAIRATSAGPAAAQPSQTCSHSEARSAGVLAGFRGASGGVL